jgi:hypothetical protein
VNSLPREVLKSRNQPDGEENTKNEKLYSLDAVIVVTNRVDAIFFFRSTQKLLKKEKMNLSLVFSRALSGPGGFL